MATTSERRIVELVLKAVGDTEVKRMTAELVKMRTATEESAASLAVLEHAGEKLGEQFTDIGKKLVAGFAVESIFEKIKETAESMEQLALQTQKVGIAASSLQNLDIAANLTGTNVQVLTKGLELLSKNMADLAGKGGPATKFLRDLGITAKTDVYEAFTKVSEQFAKMSDGAQKTALALAVFGKAGAELIPMLNSSAELLKEVAEVSENWGTKLSDHDVAAVAELTDHVKILTAEVSALTKQFVAGLAPALDAIAKQLLEAHVQGGLFAATGRLIGDVILNITGGFEIFWGLLKAVSHEISSLGGDIFFLGKAFVDLMSANFAGVDADVKALTTNAHAGVMQAIADVKTGYANALGLNAQYQKALADEAPKPKPEDTDLPDLTKQAKAKKPPVDRTGAQYLAELTKALNLYTNAQEDALKVTLTQREEADKLAKTYNEAADPLSKLLQANLQITKARESGTLSLAGETEAIRSAGEQYDEAARKLDENSDAYKANQAAIEKHREELDKVRQQWGFVSDAVGEATYAIIAHTESIGVAIRKMVATIVSELAKLALEKAAAKLISSLFGSAFGSVSSSDVAGATNFDFSTISVGNVRGFASGGVIGSPTLFKTSSGIGIAGEAGPEMVAPLRRDASGNMGVGAVSPMVTVNNYAGADVGVTQTDQGVQIDIMRRQIADDIRRGGNPVAAALEGTYKVGRYAGAYR